MFKLFVGLTILLPQMVYAAALDGSQLSLIWGLPFVGMLLSIALMPLIIPHFWHHHHGKTALFWALLWTVACWAAEGGSVALGGVLHAIVDEYIPFVVLLSALFVVAGGISIKGTLVGKPVLNTILLLIGTVLASIMGTTGAAMLLIRPVIRANSGRRYQVHTIVFFIFLVANAGGILTPLGDPPLFLGFLKGVSFFWMIEHVIPHTLFVWTALLLLYFLVDSYLYYVKKDQLPAVVKKVPFSLSGKWNMLLLLGVIASVLLSGLWRSEIVWHLGEVHVALQDIVRDVLLIVIIVLSLKLTPQQARTDNGFTWAPMKEVAKLFIGIFITMVPVMAILKSGEQGALGAIVHAVSLPSGAPNDVMYFWATGVLSGFLDNAPTYLVFFNTASTDAAQMMTTLSSTLIAISLGAVFMGALSYIGNAPNLMVKAIAEENHIKMPSFFGYMIWSVCCLLPILVLMEWIFID